MANAEAIGKAAGTDAEFFVIPDVGTEIAQIERDYEAAKADVVEAIQSS